MKNGVEKKNSTKKILKKSFIVVVCMCLLFFITEPKIILSEMKDFSKILGSIYSECINLCLSYALAFFICHKFNKLKTVLTFIFAILLNTVFDVDFKGQFIHENMPIVLFASISIILATIYILLYEKIEKFTLQKSKVWLTVIFYIITTIVFALAVTAFTVHYITYYNFYGFKWWNIVLQ